VGAPKDVYDKPNNVFVGGFIGSPAMNFIHGKLDGEYFITEDAKLKVPEGKLKTLKKQDYDGKEIILGVRPEDIHNEPVVVDASEEMMIEAKVEVAELMGSEIIIYAKISGQEFVARIDARYNVQAGDDLKLAFNINKAHFFDNETRSEEHTSELQSRFDLVCRL